VPESLIRYIPSLVASGEGIQFYSSFISYSSKDEEFARRLHGRMRDAHLRVWFAPEDVQGGRKLHEQIETAIRVYDKLLIVLSEASLQSEWVMDELRKGFKAERTTGKRKLFPVRLVDFETLRKWKCFDADSGKDLAIELREYFIPDFSNWKDSAGKMIPIYDPKTTRPNPNGTGFIRDPFPDNHIPAERFSAVSKKRFCSVVSFDCRLNQSWMICDVIASKAARARFRRVGCA
jgi:hypothetical protein